VAFLKIAEPYFEGAGGPKALFSVPFFYQIPHWVRTLIGRFYIQNYHAGKVFTFKHFSAMGIKKSLIYRVIQRYEEGSDAKHKSGAEFTS
jgi:hypothetical protein